MGIEHPLLGHSWYGETAGEVRAAGKQAAVDRDGMGQTLQTASGPNLTPHQQAALEHARAKIRSTPSRFATC